ncbi:hypothetical protein A9D60_24655 [Leisingera sp. JC1]|nr:hypothetical protein A9D60_24655 [Leisingera sp. JC1]
MTPNSHETTPPAGLPFSGGDDAEKTQPPVSALRFDRPYALYQSMPQLSRLIQNQPQEQEDGLAFLMRLRASTTPEDAVTFTAFAAQPKMAVWWGYECMRLAADLISEDDRRMMELVATWTTYPDDENRFRAARAALYAPVRSPAVFLGLAVAWSGGAIAPNDPAPVPEHRAPRAINSAVLSCLSKAALADRPVRLARFIDLAAPLFRTF